MTKRDELDEFKTEIRNFLRELPSRFFPYAVIVFIMVSFAPSGTAGFGAFIFFLFAFFPSKSFWEALRRYLRRNDTS